VPQSQTISYAQRYEDMHLSRCFDAQASGFYIDIGAGHPVYDNVSFAFYLRGWRGITVEPNPWLAQLSGAVRPCDTRIESLVGAVPGKATYYLIEDFHGLSTMVEDHARAARSEYGKRSQALSMPVVTLAALCEQYAPAEIDFLKIDVEGAEQTVIEGGAWDRFRPKVVVAEALAPITLAPAWDKFEPLLVTHGYRFTFLDGLNRYYVANECRHLAARLADAPGSYSGIIQFHDFKPAQDDPRHPDHRLAVALAGTDMVRLPLLSSDELTARLTAGLTAGDLQSLAMPTDFAAVHQRLFGKAAPADWTTVLALKSGATLRELYRRVVATDAFRTACGRISASYAW
jgi:FkbM family methyltransferase